MKPRVRREVLLTATEILAILSVAGVLVALWWLVPEAIEARFVVHLGDEPTHPVSLLTAAYFHDGTVHLLQNVVWYLFGAALSYVYCRSIDERQWYWLTVLWLLIVVPVIANLLDLHVYRPLGLLPSGSSRGFSAVGAGFGGFLVVSTVALVHRELSRPWALGLGLWILTVAGTLSVIIEETPGIVTAVSAIAASLLFGAAVYLRTRHKLANLDTRRLQAGVLFAVPLTIAILAVMLESLFPADPTATGPFTNVYAHATGLVLGVVVPLWGRRYWSRTDW